MGSGSTSFVQKTRQTTVKNSRRNESAAPGGSIGIPVDRDGGLIDELKLKFRVAAAFAVAPTGVDVRQLIERVNIRSSVGDLVKSLSGQQFFDLARLTENSALPFLVPGAGAGAVGSVEFSIDYHFEMDGAYFDSATSLKTNGLTKLDLEVIVASQAKMEAIGFVGGTFAAVPAIVMSIDPELGVRPEMFMRADVGTHDQFTSARADSSTVTGIRTIELDPNNMTRFIMLHVDNVAGGTDAAVPSDAIVGTVKITQGTRILADTDFGAMRANTQAKRGENITGFAVLDFGDQNGAFADLNETPVQLQFEVLAGSPAWRVEVAQNFAKPKAGL